MNRVFLLLGSNIGNRQDVIITAIRQINNTCGKVVQASALYETAPWGIAEQDLFLNAIVEIDTAIRPLLLLDKILAIEQELGRTRLVPKNGPRIIDIDILLYGDRVIDEENLKIPHPQMHKRRFTLLPLAEIAKEYIHPVFNKTVEQLLAECTDTLGVKPTGTIEWQ